MDVQSIVRGHHVYKLVWTPVTGEELTVLPEENNIDDSHAVAVIKEEEIVGHIAVSYRYPEYCTLLRLEALWGSLLLDNWQMKVWCGARNSLRVQGKG